VNICPWAGRGPGRHPRPDRPRLRPPPELGFEKPLRQQPSTGQRSRFFRLEFSAAASLILCTSARLAEEVIPLGQRGVSASCGSPTVAHGRQALMRQKKNPDVPELVGRKDRRGVRHLQGLLDDDQGPALAYNKISQEDKEAPLSMWSRTTEDWPRSDGDLIEEGIASAPSGWSKAVAGAIFPPNATDVADYLVAGGCRSGRPTSWSRLVKPALGRRGAAEATCPWSAGSCCIRPLPPTSTPPSPRARWCGRRSGGGTRICPGEGAGSPSPAVRARPRDLRATTDQGLIS